MPSKEQAPKKRSSSNETEGKDQETAEASLGAAPKERGAGKLELVKLGMLDDASDNFFCVVEVGSGSPDHYPALHFSLPAAFFVLVSTYHPKCRIIPPVDPRHVYCGRTSRATQC